MSIGVNYEAPDYKVIEFDASDVMGAALHDIVPVPEKHRVIGTCKIGEMIGQYGSRACYDAPSGTKNMLII